MKILVAGYFSAFWHEEAWVRALREIGHKVFEFRMAPYFNGTLIGRAQNRLLIGPSIEKLNNDFLITVQQCKPDLVVCYRALPLKPNTIQRLKQNDDYILVSYNNDNIFGPLKHKSYWRYFRKAIPYYDLNIVFRDTDIPRYREHSAKRLCLLFHHYLPWLHRPMTVNLADDGKSDICFLGHCEPDRRLNELDKLMKNVPCNYKLHGALWDKYGTDRAWKNMDTHAVQGEEYVKYLCGAKIALAFFSSWNEDNYTTRVFEIPACGTFMLSQRTEIMQGLYEEDKEVVYFDTAEELVDKARFYLSNEPTRLRIAAAGHQRCMRSGYDIHSRMREWLSAVERLKTG